MKEFLVFVFFVFVLPGLFDTYKRYEYKFCKQRKGKSSRRCRNWTCKKIEECEFSSICGRRVYDKPVTGSHEVCQKKYCRHSKECTFYIDNWERSQKLKDFGDELCDLSNKLEVLDKICDECREKDYLEIEPFDEFNCELCNHKKCIDELREQYQGMLRRMNEVTHRDSCSAAVKDK